MLGSGAHSMFDPFKVTVRYRLEGKEITYSIESAPWATVKIGGVTVGSASPGRPVPPQKSTGLTVFELSNAGENRNQRFNFRFIPL